MINEELLINLRKMRDLRDVYKQTLQELTIAEVSDDIKIKANNEYVESAEKYESEIQRIKEFIKSELEIACKEVEDFFELENNTQDSLQDEYLKKCKHSYISEFFIEFYCIRKDITFDNYETEKEEYELHLDLLKFLSFEFSIICVELTKFRKLHVEVEEDNNDYDCEEDLSYCYSSIKDSISNTVCTIAHYLRRENEKIKEIKSSIEQKKRKQSLQEFYDRFAQLIDKTKSLDEFLKDYFTMIERY